MSYISMFFRTIFFGLVTFSSLLSIYQSRTIIFRATEFGLQVIIEYLTNLQSYVRQEVNQSMVSNFCKEVPNVLAVNNNYDLSHYQHQCPHHRYITRMIERSPLIVYIEQFLTHNEIEYLINLTEPFFKPSMTFGDNGKSSFSKNRTSSSAYISRHQTPIVKCIEQRFAQFEGDVDIECIEPLQVVKYTSDEQYKPHYDWLSDSNLLKNGGQRVTTFFTYLQANCSSGETEFVDVRFNKSLHERFCDILMCDEKSSERGIRFRPLPGNTIFWFNMDQYGQPDYMTYHAGRPPGENGHKIGLNTWTRVDKYFSPPKN